MSKDCGRRVADVFLNAVYNIPPKLASKLKKYDTVTDLCEYVSKYVMLTKM